MERSGRSYAKELIFAIALTAVTIAVQKSMTRPDVGRTLGMRAAWSVRRFADGQVKMWRDVSGKAAEVYDGFRP